MQRKVAAINFGETATKNVALNPSRPSCSLTQQSNLRVWPFEGSNNAIRRRFQKSTTILICLLGNDFGLPHTTSRHLSRILKIILQALLNFVFLVR